MLPTAAVLVPLAVKVRAATCWTTVCTELEVTVRLTPEASV